MPKVKIETSCGDFTVTVHPEWAPRGVERFLSLVRANFFDGIRFFRVVKQPRPFIVQFGISGDPDTAAKWRDQNIKDDEVRHPNSRGTLTFATSGPNSRTTQLFINYGDNSFLDSQGFSPIGIVEEGMETVDAINGEYGESPDQGSIQHRGNAYLEEKFPRLDYIKTVVVVEE